MARGHAPPHVRDTTGAVGEGALSIPFIFSQNPPLFRKFRGQTARRPPLAAAKGFSAMVGHFLNRQSLLFQQLPHRQLNGRFKPERTGIMHGNGYREFSPGRDTVVGHKFVSAGDSDVTGIFLKGLMAVGAGDNDSFHAVFNEEPLHFVEDVLKMLLTAQDRGKAWRNSRERYRHWGYAVSDTGRRQGSSRDVFP